MSARCGIAASEKRFARQPGPFSWRSVAILGMALLSALALGTLTDARAQAVSPPAQAAPALPSFAPLARKVLPAVVNVSATLKAGATSDEDSGDDQSSSPFDELLRRFFEQQGIPQPPQNERDIALGSGFIIDPSGYVVTNGHVVQNADKVTVIFNDNSRHPAKIVGQDSLTDLALLKIDAPQPLPYVSWGDSDAAEVGDWVLAVGNPFGLGNTISFGLISARGRDIHAGPYDDFLQIDASINRGNSGGPTFDLGGRVIGVNTAIYSPNGGSVGIGFAIPSSLAKPVIDQIRDHGKVSRGWLGVQIQEVTPNIAKSLSLPTVGGALIANVTEGGPGAKAGLKPGDIVLAFDGHEVAKPRDLSVVVAQTAIGRNADLELWRDGARIHLAATIAAMPENLRLGQNNQSNPPRSVPQPPRTTVLGLQLAPLNDNLRQRFHIGAGVKGVVVLGIAPSGPFVDQNIQVGDTIETIDRQPVSSPADVMKKMTDARSQKRDSVLLLIYRAGTNLFVVLSLNKGDDSDHGG